MSENAATPAHRNPFRVGRLHALGFRFPPGEDLETLCARLLAAGGRGAIVGPHGSGKTTLLEQLAARLRRDGWRVRSQRIGRGQRSLDAAERAALLDGLGPGDAVLLDGAGHLHPLAWRGFRRGTQAAGLVVVTCHRRGRLPTLLRTATSPGLLVELCAELGEPIETGRAAALWRNHRGDLRAALRALYDVRAVSRAARHE
jgi:hypothetical protein